MKALALRSEANTKTDKEKIHVFGVKWPTYLSKIMPDFIRGMGIDDLHHSYHGVGHKFLELWTLPKYKSQPWSLYSKIDLIDERLQNVRLPNFVQCGVRTLSNLSLWKGQHMKIFLLYLALPVLEGILPTEYYNNFAAFVHCLYILNSSEITPDDLLFCSRELDNFVFQFQRLYGERHMTINIHNTLHLCFAVNNLGPMRCFSCFPFESLNGEMLKMIHGTKYVQIQLANCAYLFLSFPNEISNMKCPLVEDFAKNLHHSYQKVKLLECVSPNVYAAGNYIELKDVHVDVVDSLRLAGEEPSTCTFFNKLKKGPNLFVAQTYLRATKTASYLVSYDSNSTKRYAIILYFVKRGSTASFQAVIKSVTVRNFHNDGRLKSIKHILRYSTSQEISFVDVNLLQNICFSVEVEGRDPFICERNNWLEIE